jgi:hypothetical protein
MSNILPANWLNAFTNEKPKHPGKYFVVINGMKNIIHSVEFDHYLEKADTFYWLRETDEDNKILHGLSQPRTCKIRKPYGSSLLTTKKK